MNEELKELINFVKTNSQSTKSMADLVGEFFSQTEWSMLKDEFCRMTMEEKEMLFRRLFEVRFGKKYR